MNAPTHGEAQDATLALDVCVSACMCLECGWALRQATVFQSAHDAAGALDKEFLPRGQTLAHSFLLRGE
eukprot:6965020-Pyramimonas_sp.AAC.1